MQTGALLVLTLSRMYWLGAKLAFFPFRSIIWFTRTSLILISLIIEYTVASEKTTKKPPNLLELPRCLH